MVRDVLDRRAWLGGLASVLAAGCRRSDATAPVPSPASTEPTGTTPSLVAAEVTMQTRPIPKTGERLPVIGLGTWSTFDVGDRPADRDPLREVLRRFLDAGARVIDSSPMYGRAEAVAGQLLATFAPPAFVATKVWTRGKARGIAEMERSIRLLGHVDLMQVHNLVDVDTHMPTLRAWKAEGRIRHLGVTHYELGAFDELEKWIRTGELDFVQLPYSVRLRDAEARLLPAAADAGCAVLVMRPFEEGRLFAAARGKALPGVATELGCTSWAQVFLKWILGHPAVTCPIPATAKPDHMTDNVGAGQGPLPDAEQRARIVAALA